jgi:hypothetical protein
MKKLVFILLLIPLLVFCEDMILLKSGEKIFCTVLSEDSTGTIEYEVYKNKRVRNEKINRNQISIIKYGINKTQTNDNTSTNSNLNKDSSKTSCMTIGILCGGGSLIGIDLEKKISKYVSIQLGGGFVGFGAAINVHTNSLITSNYFSFGYWHQGIGTSFTQDLIGPSYVYRANWLALQLGAGIILSRGPAYPSNMSKPAVILTYSAGVFF